METKARIDIDDKFKWNNDDYFKNEREYHQTCEKLERDLQKIVDYKGKLGQDGKTLFAFLSLYNELSERMEEIYCFGCYFNFHINIADSSAQKCKSMAEKLLQDYNNVTSFVDGELLKVNFSKLKEEEPKLDKYNRFFEIIYENKKYILSEKEERILALSTNVLSGSRSIYDALMSNDIDFGKIKDENGKMVQLTKANYSTFLRNKDRNVRKRAYKATNAFYKKFVNTIGYTYKATVNNYMFKYLTRGYKSPLEMNLHASEMNEKVFYNLIDVVGNNTNGLKRFNEIKRKLLGLKEMHFYDSKLTPELEIKDEVDYEKGLETISNALKILGSDYSATLNRYLNNNMIDVYPAKGKYNNGYQASSYRKMPRILYNYRGTYQDFYGVAHEIGHAMHTHYADISQPYVYHDYSLILAETASLTNEVLLTEYMMSTAKNKNEKIYYLIKLLEEIDNYLFNTCVNAEHEHSFYQSELDNKSMSIEEMCNKSYEITKRYYASKTYVIDDEEKYSWMHYGHYHSPYYFYKYAIGMCAALVIGSKIVDNEKGFREKYLNFLSSGSSIKTMDAYKALGIDLEDKNTYLNAIKYFESKIDELENLVNE